VRATACALAFATVIVLLASGSVPCAFARLTHLPCPGCGSTRAMVALARGDLAGVLRSNPLAPLFTALVALLGVQALASIGRTGGLDEVASGRFGSRLARALVVVAILEVALWLARFGGLLGGPVPV